MTRARSQTCSDWQSTCATKAANARWAKRVPPPDEPGEEWRDVPSYPGYQGSSLGRVRSRYALLKGHPRGKLGHLYVSPSVDGKQKPEAVHRMVCEAFHGPCPPRHECRHKDGKPENNKPDNLTWGTKLENQRDRAEHGTDNSGERNGRAKISNEVMENLAARARANEDPAALAAEFGLSVSYVKLVASGWRGPGATRRKKNSQ